MPIVNKLTIHRKPDTGKMRHQRRNCQPQRTAQHTTATVIGQLHQSTP